MQEDSTIDTKKEKPMIGRQIVCSLCGNGNGTLQKDGKGGYVHQQKPCPAKPKEKED